MAILTSSQVPVPTSLLLLSTSLAQAREALAAGAQGASSGLALREQQHRLGAFAFVAVMHIDWDFCLDLYSPVHRLDMVLLFAFVADSVLIVFDGQRIFFTELCIFVEHCWSVSSVVTEDRTEMTETEALGLQNFQEPIGSPLPVI